MTDALDGHESRLLDDAERTIEAARAYVDRSSNVAMVHAYWLIGRDIVEIEQAGAARAGYGDELVERVSGRLTDRFGRGFSARTVRRIRQFYRVYPEGSKLPVDPHVAKIRSALLAESGPDEIRTTLLAKSSDRVVALFPPTLGWSHYANLPHQDLGQMQMYVNLYDRTERSSDEAPTVGIVLCSDKNDAMVRITLPENSQVHASRYQLYLPTEAELSVELARERDAAERELRAAAAEADGDDR